MLYRYAPMDRCVSTRQMQWDRSHVCSSFQWQVTSKTLLVRSGDLGWPQMTLTSSLTWWYHVSTLRMTAGRWILQSNRPMWHSWCVRRETRTWPGETDILAVTWPRERGHISRTKSHMPKISERRWKRVLKQISKLQNSVVKNAARTYKRKASWGCPMGAGEG